MSKAREAGRKLLTPGELYLHDELEAMRKENEGAHNQISLNISREVGRLHDAMDGQFKAVNERFDKLEKMVLRAIDVGKGRI